MKAADSHAYRRQRMVESLRQGGVTDERLLAAMAEVPRHLFVPGSYRNQAYSEDVSINIGEGQTISQPRVMALMTEAARIQPENRVLEIGTGSGYAAAVLAEIAAEVHTVERYANLAESARERLARLGSPNVHVLCGDGTRGWPEHAPYDAIVVPAGGPEVPISLREQIAVGSRLVIPVGPTARLQKLVRVTRVAEHRFEQEELLEVAFVPLVGAEGWREGAERPSRSTPREAPPAEGVVVAAIAAACEPFDDLESADLEPLLARIGDARIVLLGEATQGTSEFYRMRARITRELVERKGFTIVAAEADWPDAARIDDYLRDLEHPAPDWIAFTRFPTWMWANRSVLDFVEWLKAYNAQITPLRSRVGFYGLDLYSLSSSIDAVGIVVGVSTAELVAYGVLASRCLQGRLSIPMHIDIKTGAAVDEVLDAAGFATANRAMKLVGHKTESIYRRYAIVARQDLVDGLKRLAECRAGLDKGPAQQKLIQMQGAAS